MASESGDVPSLAYKRLSVQCMDVNMQHDHSWQQPEADVWDLMCAFADTNTEGCFLGADLHTPFGARGVFGGQIFAQALVAATLTVDKAKFVHSMHGYFLRSVDDATAVYYLVDQLRDGNSYATREVKAFQEDRLVFVGLVSFHIAETSTFSHQVCMTKLAAEFVEFPEIGAF
eukprot:gb/GECG01003997.1/.p1 GENE.gb/GECG01003997.1/~~gb/GECG01003997.1/.p1  ORF type:complete len:173 (+),score=18.40 gb/GECG01003997.1/:1-519(+)